MSSCEMTQKPRRFFLVIVLPCVLVLYLGNGLLVTDLTGEEFPYRSHLQFGDKAALYSHVEKVIIGGNHCYALLEAGSGKIIIAKINISLPSTQ